MQQVKDGHIEKLGLLYERYKKPMYGFFYRMTRNAGASEDMVQTVFMKILKSKHTFTGEGQFATWAYRIARNVNYDAYRKDHSKENTDIDQWHETLAHTDDVENEYVKSDQMKQLSEAIDQLTPEQKEVILLSRYEEFKYTEIGEILGCSEGAVKMKVRRALLQLKVNFIDIEKGIQHVS